MKGHIKIFEGDLVRLANEIAQIYCSQKVSEAVNLIRFIKYLGTLDIDIDLIPKEHYYLNRISGEISGAEDYYKKYIETGEIEYKNIARDELNHAGFFIKQIMSEQISSEEQARLNDLINLYDKVHETLK